MSANYQDPDEAAGQSVLPRARIMKIIKADDDIYQCNKQATHLVAVATEMFIQYLAEQGVRSLAAERKQRKTVQYKDLASAVARIDNLEFLSDVIPQVVVAKQPRETKAAKSKKKPPTTETGQSTLGALFKPQNGPASTSPDTQPDPDSDSASDNGKSVSRKDKGKGIHRAESSEVLGDEDVVMK